MVRNRITAMAALLASSILLIGGTSATAAVPADDAPTAALPPAAINNPDVPLDVIMALPEQIKNDSDVRIDPDLDPTVPIIDTSGNLVPGQTSISAQAASACSTTVWGPPGTWSGAVNSTCSIWGSPGWRVTYRFSQAPNVSTLGCGQATGWNAQYQEFWTGLGCGASGTATVDWGNVIAQPKLKAYGANPPAGTTLVFVH